MWNNNIAINKAGIGGNTNLLLSSGVYKIKSEIITRFEYIKFFFFFFFATK